MPCPPDADQVLPSCRGPKIAGLLTTAALLLAAQDGAATHESTLPRPTGEGPRNAVMRVADLIEDNYFDAAQGHAIAASLRTAAQAGEFDALRQPRDLATGLTLLLRPLDHHFRVVMSNGA